MSGGSTPSESDASTANAAFAEEVNKNLAEIRRRTSGAPRFDPMADAAIQKVQLEVQDARAVLGMKKRLGYAAFFAVGAQLLIADIAFVWYSWSRGWNVPPEVMIGWLSATVVQVVGVVLVIARHLFPNRVMRD